MSEYTVTTRNHCQKESEGIIRIRISKKNRQHNDQKEKYKKDKQRSTKHTQKTKDRVTRTPLKTKDRVTRTPLIIG